jgi:hypothetical protein
MAAFIAEFDMVNVHSSTTLSNVAIPTSGPATVLVTNTGSNGVIVGLTQGGAPTGNVVIPGGWPMVLQCPNPERTPGTVYVWVTALAGTPEVYVSSGFEV